MVAIGAQSVITVPQRIANRETRELVFRVLDKYGESLFEARVGTGWTVAHDEIECCQALEACRQFCRERGLQVMELYDQIRTAKQQHDSYWLQMMWY